MTTDEFIRSRPPLNVPVRSHFQSRTWQLFCFWFSLVLLAVAVAIWCSTFFGLGADWSFLLVPLAWFAMGLSGPDMDWGNRLHARRRIFHAEIPRDGKVVFSVLMLAALANFVVTMVTIDGTPERLNGEYVLARKGEAPEVLTEPEFVLLSREYSRACSGLGAAISLAGTFSLGFHLRRSHVPDDAGSPDSCGNLDTPA